MKELRETKPATSVVGESHKEEETEIKIWKFIVEKLAKTD
jgi:hypothetical protein